MIAIKDIHDQVNFYAGKNRASKYSPTDIDAVVYESMIEIFNELYADYVKTTKVSFDLEPFKAKTQIDLSSGLAAIQDEFKYSRYFTVGENDINIQRIEDGFWSNAVNDKLDPPTEERPIYTIESDGGENNTKQIKVRPTSITQANYYYFRIPTKPVFAYITGGTNNDKYIYQEAGTVNVEFNVFWLPQLIAKVTKKLGIPVRDSDLYAYKERQEQLNRM